MPDYWGRLGWINFKSGNGFVFLRHQINLKYFAIEIAESNFYLLLLKSLLVGMNKTAEKFVVSLLDDVKKNRT